MKQIDLAFVPLDMETELQRYTSIKMQVNQLFSSPLKCVSCIQSKIEIEERAASCCLRRNALKFELTSSSLNSIVVYKLFFQDLLRGRLLVAGLVRNIAGLRRPRRPSRLNKIVRLMAHWRKTVSQNTSCNSLRRTLSSSLLGVARS